MYEEDLDTMDHHQTCTCSFFFYLHMPLPLDYSVGQMSIIVTVDDLTLLLGL